MGKKDLGAVFGCNKDRLFSEKYTVKDYISNTKLEKGDHLDIMTETVRFNYIRSSRSQVPREIQP